MMSRSVVCTRWRRVTTLARRAPAGPGSLTFKGRVRGRLLVPGRYRAKATATDLVGNRSRPRSLRLTSPLLAR